MAERIVFANQLRGVAAVAVATSHLLGVYWLIRGAVTWATLTPPLEGPNSPWVGLIQHPWFNLGPFGVGLFFLISGLVIPISLEQFGPGRFLVARVLRIYPVYVVALLIELLVLRGNAALWHRAFPFGGWTIASNLLLIQDLVHQPSLDLVNWTLAIELRFYVVMALVAGAVRRGSVVVLFAIAGAALLMNVAVARGVFGAAGPDTLGYAVSMEPLFIVFMLMGVLFNYHLRGRLGSAGLVVALAAMGVIFALCWRISAIVGQWPGVTMNYGCALLLFGGLYAVRRHVPNNRLLDAMAAISFPFYCVHSLVGYSVLKLLMLRFGWGYPAALPMAVLVVVALAVGLHASVEVWGVRRGRALRRRGERGQPTAPHATVNAS